jgi:hypothetical protein
MSQENVERWRAQIEAVWAGTSEFDPEVTISKMAELGTRKWNWMPPRLLRWTSAGSTGE